MAKSAKAVPTAATVNVIPRSVQIAMLVAIVGGALFIQPYLSAILFSALIAFIFNPVYKAVMGRTKSNSLAISATIVVAILSFLIPVIFVAGVTISQASSLVAKIQTQNVSVGPAQVDDVVERGTDRINALIASFPGGEAIKIDKQKVLNTVKDLTADFVQGLVDFIKRTSGAVAGFISTAILSFFLIVGMLKYQAELVRYIKNLSPFDETVTSSYLSRAGVMTKAMVKGQLIIAIAQGFASAASLWLMGIDYFWFFFVLLTFLSFIPLGAGILTIPIGIVMMLTGNVWQGAFIVLFHMFGVSNIDNLLRPRLVPKSARMNSALVLLAVFSGLALFGAAGVVYGPVLMIILITTFDMYAEYSRRTTRPATPVAETANAS